MPNATKSRRVKSKAPAETETTTNGDTPDMTTTETRGPKVSFDVYDAPEDYKPERRHPGRERTPSFFDDLILEKKDQGWQIVPTPDEETRKDALRELNRAKMFRRDDGVGLDLNVAEDHVAWRSRDLQKRRPRKADQEALAANQGELDPDGDNDE